MKAMRFLLILLVTNSSSWIIRLAHCLQVLTQSCARGLLTRPPHSWLGNIWSELTTTGGATTRAPLPVIFTSEPSEASSVVGTIRRLAIRPYNATTSKPSSRFYSTRKESVPEMIVTPRGGSAFSTRDSTVKQEDYNHYRTMALKSTPDRALSILTDDVMDWLQQQETYADAQAGDLGENILVEGLAFDALQVGQKYRMGSSVVVEITEPVVPCANLCKLRYINDPDKSPPERIQACQEFIVVLGQADGLRGWYAKVLQTGNIKVGDTMQLGK